MLRKARGSSEADKLVVVKAIYENKRLLLGDFDDSKGITKNAKQEKWKAIFGQLQAIGNGYGNQKSYIDLRDTTWKNFRKSFKVCFLKNIP